MKGALYAVGGLALTAWLAFFVSVHTAILRDNQHAAELAGLYFCTALALSFGWGLILSAYDGGDR